MKNYSFFFLGIVLPGVINFFAIPIFKRELGDSVYGEYNLLLTTLLMANMVVVGWISHSIIRLASQRENKSEFIQDSLWLSTIVSMIASIVGTLALLLIFKSNFLTAILSGLLLIVSAQQLVLNGASQSYLKAKVLMFAESAKVGIGFAIGYGLILLFGLNSSIEKILLGLVISNIISCIILFRGIGLNVRRLSRYNVKRLYETSNEVFGYGIYLVLWFIFSYALMYNDRYLIFYSIGKEMAGHYTALFDIISRTITIAALPLLMSTFPILTKHYDDGHLQKVDKLINRLLLIECVSLPLAIISYWAFGYKILIQLLKLPEDGNLFFWPGLFILAGSIIGQIGMIAHKRMELKKETPKMFKIIFGVFIFALFSNLLLIDHFGIVGTSMTYLIGTSAYAATVLLFKRW